MHIEEKHIVKNRSTVCGIVKVLAELLRALDNTILKTMALVQFPSTRATETERLPDLPRPEPDGRRARLGCRLPHSRGASFPFSWGLNWSFWVCFQPSAAGSVGEGKVDLGKPWKGKALERPWKPWKDKAQHLRSAHTATFSPRGANRQPP